MQKGIAATTLSAMSTPPLLLLYDADVLHRFPRCEALPGVTCSHWKLSAVSSVLTQQISFL